MNQHLDILKNRIQEGDEFERNLARWRFASKRIVFTNGCFDILHRGHVEYLAQAADLGDILVVGLNSDASVTRIKGRGRPLNDETSRALVLSALRFVDAVVLFWEDTPIDLIRRVMPDVLVKGGDYKEDEIVGAKEVKAHGGRVVTIDLVRGHSTTGLLRSIRESKSK